jgi:hypothetical protein
MFSRNYIVVQITAYESKQVILKQLISWDQENTVSQIRQLYTSNRLSGEH